ncbi:MAG: hybrid sensor histidine kinase/response regulator, partial [Nitrospirae bacterium]
MRILIAEDDAATRRTLEHLLGRWGHRVVACADGEEAWGRFRERPAELLLADWVMPRCDGLELCRRVRGDPAGRGVEILMLTARSDLAGVEQALAAGADDYLTKPVDPARLKIRLQVAAHRLELHARLWESEARQGYLLDSLPAIVWAVAREGVITYAAGAGLEALGLEAEELAGRSFRDLFAASPEILEAHLRAFSGREVVVEDRFQGRSLVARVRPLLDNAGTITGAVGVAQDVSNERQLEAQITQAAKMEILGQLVAGIAHDFNNLLTGMMGHVELLQLDAGEELKADLAELMEQVRHGSELTRQLLAFSRRREPGMAEVELGDVCGQAVRLLRRTVKGGMEIRLRV